MNQPIAFIIHNCKEGGSVGAVAWRQIIELSRYARVYVITVDAPDISNENVVPIIIKPSKWNFLRRLCHLPNEISFQDTALSALYELIKEKKIVAVWCHSHGTVVWISKVCKRHNVKIIMTTHGDIFERPAGAYNWQLTWYYKLVTKKAYKNADRVQALSPYMAKWAIKNGAEEGKVSVIPNGISIEDIGASISMARKVDTFVLGGVFKILFVGDLLPHKGFDSLLKSTKELVVSNIKVEVICVGDGPEKFSLKRMSEDLNLNKVVQFVGRVPKNYLHEYYCKADILCVPSTSDTLPTVILEAFAMGLPVVGANTGGIPYMLKEGQNGWLFEPGNVNSLVAQLKYAIKDQQILAAISERCILSAKKDFSWDIIGRKLRNLIPINQ